MHLLSNLGSDFVARVGIYEAFQLPLTLVMILCGLFLARHPIALFAKFENHISKLAHQPYLFGLGLWWGILIE